MSPYALLALDLVAICVLAFGVYFPRHRRRGRRPPPLRSGLAERGSPL